MAKNFYVHPSSYIDDPVIIGKGTMIMHFCHIMSHSIIANNCRIGRNVTIESGVIIGNNVVIEDNVTLKSGIIIEDDVVLGHASVFTLAPVFRQREIQPRVSKLNPTIVKVGVSIGANSTIICGNSLGLYAMIGAGSVITKPVPDYAFVYGNPAKPAGWACKCGKAINFFNAEAKCKDCNSIYKMIGNKDVVKVA
jgi:UDP-2-acetamido-3-amino-2,3-dideoxy-glucuronate N-acetyltransferase